MERSTMLDAQESSLQAGLRVLARQQVLRLRRRPQARRLVVVRGLLWVTPTPKAGGASADHWLAAGESLDVAAGVELVVQAWSDAAFELQGSALPAAAHWRRAARRWWARALRWRPAAGARAPAACSG